MKKALESMLFTSEPVKWRRPRNNLFRSVLFKSSLPPPALVLACHLQIFPPFLFFCHHLWGLFFSLSFPSSFGALEILLTDMYLHHSFSLCFFVQFVHFLRFLFILFLTSFISRFIFSALSLF